MEDFVVGDFGDEASGFLGGLDGSVPAGGVADLDGGGDGFGFFDGTAVYDGRGAGGLESVHFRVLLCAAVAKVFLETLPVGGDVAGVADGQEVKVWRSAELVADFEGGGFLALDADGVDAVDDFNGSDGGKFADKAQGDVEVAVDGDGLGSVDEGLGKFAHGDVAVRQDDDAFEFGAGGIGGGGSGSVAGAGADDGLGAFFAGFADGHGHASVFERCGGV